MATAPRKSPLESLRNFVPLNLLPEEDLYTLLEKAVFEKLGKNQILFSEGDTDNQNVYLLSGKVQLISGDEEMDKVDCDSETARFPLAHQIPRKFTAVAPKQAEVVRIDSRLLGELVVKAGQEDHDSDEEGDVAEDDWMTQLLHLRVFQQIPPSNIQRVMMCMEEVELKAGEVVVRQGEDGDYFYLIHKGHCVVTRVAESDGEHEEVARLAPGDSFGEESLLSGLPRAGSVTMLSDGHLLKLGKEDFVRYVKDSVTCSVSHEQALSGIEGGAIWIDVRSPSAYEEYHLPGSISLPLISLRYQSSSLDPDLSYIIYCDDGRSSVTAAFLLLELGYQVTSLEAGLSGLAPETVDGNAETVDENAKSSVDSEVLQEAEARLKDLEAEKEQLLKDLGAEKEQLLKDLDAEKEQLLAGLEAEKEQLKKGMLESAEELVGLRNTLKERDDEISRLSSKLSRVSMQLKENRGNDETGLLREELAEAVTARESAEQELKHQIRILEQKKSEAVDPKVYEAELATLTDALEDSEKSCEEAVERAGILEKERIQQDAELQQMQSQREELDLQASTFSDEKEELKLRTSKLSNEKEELKLQASTLSNEKEELRKEFASYQQLLDDSNKELDHLIEEYHDFKVQIEAKYAGFDQMQQELNEARMEADEAHFRRKEAQDSHQQVEDALYQARQEVEENKYGGKLDDDTQQTFGLPPEVQATGSLRKMMVGALLGAILTFSVIDGLFIMSGNEEIVSSLLKSSGQAQGGTVANGTVKMAAKGTPVSSKGKQQ